MAGLGELFGRNGILEQLLLWGVVNQVISTMGGPALAALNQDINQRHPLLALSPDVAAQAVARHMLAEHNGQAEAARAGIDAGRFATMTQLAKQRLAPDVLAQAVVRGMVPLGDAEHGAELSGLDPAAFLILRDLAKIRLPVDQLAAAVDRGIIAEGQAEGQAELQGIDREWFGVIRALGKVRLPPAQLADAVVRGIVPEGQAEGQAALQGIDGHWFGVLRTMATVRLPPAQLAQAVERGIVGEGQAEGQAALQGIDGHWFGVLRALEATRLPPATLAQAVEHNLMGAGPAAAQAALQGITGQEWTTLRELERVRLAPADLATAMLRSYLTAAQAAAQAEPQGVSREMLGILADLAGDAPGPDQLVTALLRGIIGHHGRGADSTSFDQGIAETRLHNKWGPVLQALGQAVLSPPDAASAVIRNFMTEHEGQAEAAKTGVDADRFAIMRHLAGDAPGPQQLAEALRRGAIHRTGTGPNSTSFEQGIAEGRLADKWAPVIEALAKLWPTPVDALDAALKGQVTHEEGKRLYELLGGDLEFYPWLLASQGSGPSPLEAADWARRGIIPWDGVGPEVTSYAQAVKESRFRDKWAGAYRAGANYLPPPETVRTLLEQGALDQAEATRLWREAGLSEPDIAAYLHAAAFNNTAATRGLAINEVLNLFYSQVIGKAETDQLLQLFHVPKHTADLLVSYTEVRRDIAAITTAVRRVNTLLGSRKISTHTARQALERLHIPGAAIDGLITTMELEASINVKTLTEAQIVDAWEVGAFADDEAMAELEAIGYTRFDAWALMSVKAKQPLPNKPDRNVAPPPGIVIPGVT